MAPYGIIDLHCDTLTAFRNQVRAADALNDPNAHFSLSNVPQQSHWAQCCAIFLPDQLRGQEAICYYARHQRLFGEQMAKFPHLVCPCRSAKDLEQTWCQGKTAAFLTVENGSALAGQMERVEQLAADGVKIITLTWNGRNEIGSGWDTEEGLSDFGRAVIPELERQGILADISHLNDTGFFQALDVLEKPFVATHSNARAICSHRRNLTDDQIREMVSRGCLIGLNYYHAFLKNGGNACREDLFCHLAHFLELGGEDCMALGSDFDGADIPGDLDRPEKVAGLYHYLLDRGLGKELCDKVFYRNALDFFQSNLG